MSDIRSFAASVSRLWRTREALHFRNIRRSHLHYFFAFPLAMIFINVQDRLLAMDMRIWGLPAITFTFISFAVGATFSFIFATVKIISRISRISAMITIAGFIPWLFLPSGYPDFICAMIFMVGVGGCLSCSGFSFVFVQNNTERFLGSLLMTLVITLMKINFGLLWQFSAFRIGFIIILVVGLSVCMYASKYEDYTQVEKRSVKKIDPAIWLVLFIFFSYFTIRILGFYVPESQIQLSTQVWTALVLVCIMVLVIYRHSIWTMCNVFFIAAIMSYVMGYAHWMEPAYIFAGVKEIGQFVTFYLLGCVSNKFCDFRIHKILVVICMTSMGALFVVPDLLLNTTIMHSAAVTAAVGFFIIFLMFSPAFAKHLFNADWSEGLRRLNMPESDAQVVIEQTDKFENLKLYPREKEVAALLLQGLTMRQISIELKIAQSTVNGYCNSLYKKLGINSRVELFTRFGVTVNDKTKQADNTEGK